MTSLSPLYYRHADVVTCALQEVPENGADVALHLSRGCCYLCTAGGAGERRGRGSPVAGARADHDGRRRPALHVQPLVELRASQLAGRVERRRRREARRRHEPAAQRTGVPLAIPRARPARLRQTGQSVNQSIIV